MEKELRDELQLNMEQEQSLENNTTSKEDKTMMNDNENMNVNVETPEMVTEITETAAPKRKFNLGLIATLVAVIVLALGITVIATGCKKKPVDPEPTTTTVAAEPSEEPEVTVEPSVEPEVEVSEEPVAEVSEEPVEAPTYETLEFDSNSEVLEYSRNMIVEDGLAIYRLSERDCNMVPYIDGSTLEANGEVFILYYPENPSSITFSNDTLTEYAAQYAKSNCYEMLDLMYVTEEEEITVTVAYDDGREYTMTFIYIPQTY